MAPCSEDRARVLGHLWLPGRGSRETFRALVGGLGIRRKDICNQVPEVHTDGSFVAHRVGRKQ